MDNGLEERERLLGFEGQERNDLKQRIWKEMKLTWRIAFPSILSRIASFGQILVTQSFLGHVGEIELASFALVQSIFLRFVNGILLGMSSATETLCGQAFGAGHYHMMGIYLQRSWLVDCVTATIMLPVFIFGTPIMNLLGQQKDIAETGGVISLWLIPFVYNFVFSLTIQMFLQAQLKNMIIGWLSTASFLLHVLMSWIFVSELDLGIAGAMGSLNISAWLNIIGLFVYIFCGWCPDTWKGVAVGAGMQSTVAFVNLGSYYFVGVPTGVLLAYVANLGVTGLWIGLLGGIVIQTIILSFIIWRTDWDDQVNKASQRLNKWLLKPSEKSDRSSPNM
ncbi:protein DETOXIFICATION 25 [Citrus sinensis]|uniref:Protein DETOXIFICATION 25 n=1 Tax=Citrus sinensis TaxID=2711 RepID=A0ACB8LCJ8_CITSI|nr:protein DETOXIFICATION 25 [Citrus sinensis]